MKKEIEVCDLCEEHYDEMFKCTGCNKVVCPDSKQEHLEDEHMEEILDDVMDDWMIQIEE